jgi:hypothetical protein
VAPNPVMDIRLFNISDGSELYGVYCG